MVTKKSAKKTKSTWVQIPASEDLMFTRPPHDQHLIIQVSPVTWPFLGFTQRVSADTTVFDIQSKIIAQHGGSIRNISLYKVRKILDGRIFRTLHPSTASSYLQDEVQPRNALNDLSATLSSINFVHIQSGDNGQDPVVHICYDFPPHAGDCPLLLAPPNDMKIDAHALVDSKTRNRAPGSQSVLTHWPRLQLASNRTTCMLLHASSHGLMAYHVILSDH